MKNLISQIKESLQPKVVPNRGILTKSFAWMAVGLFASAVASILFVTNESLLGLVFGHGMIGFWVIVIAELALVWSLSKYSNKFSVLESRLVFVLYAILSGVTLSSIFIMYEMVSIVTIFLTTAAIFIVFACIGKFTKYDLTKFGPYLAVTLFGLIISMLINMFLGLTWLDIVISWIGVVLFVIFTAYDVQQIAHLEAGEVMTEEQIKKAGIMGALRLYLDFINLFLNLLRLFGRRR